jgi:hypothetical protein
VINAEFGRNDHGSIPATVIDKGLEALDTRTNPRTRLRWCVVFEKEKKNLPRVRDAMNLLVWFT